MKLHYLLFSLCLAISFSACQRSTNIFHVEREDLFVLEIGIMEDQIALFDLEGHKGIRRANIAMRDGFFYISDANGAKILRYNSFGDLLFMIFNEELNPPSMSLNPLQEGILATRWSVSHPLLEPGQITVDSRSHIFVRDRLPSYRHSFDAQKRVILDNIILHFDADGRFVKFIGREGPGGTPFPRIEGVYTSIRDELVVITRHPGGWDIYWYDSEGFFLFVVQLSASALPIPPERDNVFGSLDRIAVRPDARLLYIKIDYYRNTYDELTNTRTGIEPDGSVLWILNAEDGVWENHIDIPFFEKTITEHNRRVTHRMIYSLLGVSRNGRTFFSFPDEGGYSILVLSTDQASGGTQHQGFIRVNDYELQYNVFSISDNGILSALLADDWRARLVWWRTDKFIGEAFN